MKLMSTIFFSCYFLSTVSFSQNIYGEWKIFKCRPSQTSALTEKEAQKNLGMVGIIANDYLKFFGDSCRVVLYKARKARTKEYLSYNYKISPKDLGITSNDVKIIEAHCGKVREIAGFDFIVTDEKNLEMIISRDGYFFWIKKIK